MLIRGHSDTIHWPLLLPQDFLSLGFRGQGSYGALVRSVSCNARVTSIDDILGGSWVLVSRVLNPLIREHNYSYPTYNPLITAHEPPSNPSSPHGQKPSKLREPASPDGKTGGCPIVLVEEWDDPPGSPILLNSGIYPLNYRGLSIMVYKAYS